METADRNMRWKTAKYKMTSVGSQHTRQDARTAEMNLTYLETVTWIDSMRPTQCAEERALPMLHLGDSDSIHFDYIYLMRLKPKEKYLTIYTSWII